MREQKIKLRLDLQCLGASNGPPTNDPANACVVMGAPFECEGDVRTTTVVKTVVKPVIGEPDQAPATAKRLVK